MSYCRADGEESDVYMIMSGNGLNCVACSLKANGEWWHSESHAEAIKHLFDHRAAGDKVPDRAIERLEGELVGGYRS